MAPTDTFNSPFTPVMLAQFNKGQTLLTDGLNNLKREWDACVQRVDNLLKQADHYLNSDSVWSSVCEFFTDDIKDAIKTIRKVFKEIKQKIDKIFDVLNRCVKNGFPLVSLLDFGQKYATTVLPHLSGMGGDMVGSGKIDSWRGPAHETYKTRCGDQVAAVDASTAKVRATATWLGTVATNNVAYMVQLGERVANVIGPLATLLLDLAETLAGAITQAPLALQDFSAFIGTAVTEVLTYEVNLANQLVGVLNSCTSLGMDQQDASGLIDHGHWPDPVKDPS